ncbi:MAG TPA: hypothetical protein VK907_11290, partial [Phnomibacter sp.]|nr:hypothetical protein [Phnomibacter sp.]
TTPHHDRNRVGKATGRLIGGNLALLAHLAGTISMPDTKGCILFIEDVGEYLYNIDRMLVQLDRAGKLKDLAGLVVGGFTDLKDTTIPFGMQIDDIIFSHVAKYKYPVVFDFPASHSKNNVALRIGQIHTLTVRKQGCTLTNKGNE